MSKLDRETRFELATLTLATCVPEVFRWLARAENHGIWQAEKDVLSLHAQLREVESRLANLRPTALMTLPDAVSHPRSVQWAAPGDSNLRNFVPTIKAS